MTDSPAHTLADEIEKTLLGVDGVTDVYPSAPLPEVVVGEIGAVVLTAIAPPLVTVEARDEGTVVTAVIGVDDRTPAHETGRAAHDHIVELLSGTAPQAHVTVRIAMISS